MSQYINLRYKKVVYSEIDLIEGIFKNQNWAISEIYRTQFNAIKKMVYSFRNTSLEPDEIFQEGLTRVILNIKNGKFKQNSSISTYLNGICKNICLKQLNQRKTSQITENLNCEQQEEDKYYEMLSFINQLKEQLNTTCLEIINMRFNQTDNLEFENNPANKLTAFEIIAQKLDISPANARQRFKRCLGQLRTMVFEHPEYQTLFD